MSVAKDPRSGKLLWQEGEGDCVGKERHQLNKLCGRSAVERKLAEQGSIPGSKKCR